MTREIKIFRVFYFKGGLNPIFKGNLPTENSPKLYVFLVSERLHQKHNIE